MKNLKDMIRESINRKIDEAYEKIVLNEVDAKLDQRALVNHNQTTGKIYGESKTTNCDVVPVIEALKVNID